MKLTPEIKREARLSAVPPNSIRAPEVTGLARLIDSRERGLVMGVLNVTPDSFSDGGRFRSLPEVFDFAANMVGQGADILDIGGESTRPRSEPVSSESELDRVIPVIEKLRAAFDVPISVDTSKAIVMREAVAAGATMINDVRALRGDGALQAAVEMQVPVCIMHMRGEPRTMQAAPAYENVVGEVTQFLAERVAASRRAGVAAQNIIVDPGFGFGKTLEHNLQLLRGLRQIAELGYPVLVGLSRKSMLGQILDRDVNERLYGGLALALLARQNGAAIIRSHDVGPTVDALEAMEAAMDKGKMNG
jgi:dihydropteroate synthase